MGETTPTQPREIPAGAFNEAATKAARKKTGLFTHDLPRYSVRAILVAVVIGQSAKLGGIGPDHLLGTLTEGKLTETPTGIFLEATAANFVVNMAVVGSLLIKDYAGKFFFTQFVIGIFVVLGLDHLIANFSLFSLSFFTIDGGLPHLDPAHVLKKRGHGFPG